MRPHKALGMLHFPCRGVPQTFYQHANAYPRPFFLMSGRARCFIFHAWAYPKFFYEHANAYPRLFLCLGALVLFHSAWAYPQTYLSSCERIPQAFFYAWARLFHQSHTACTRSLLINTQWKGKGGRRVRRPTKKKKP